MAMILRPYQFEAVQAVYEFLRARDDNPCVVMPTASGKTPVLATICRDVVQIWNGRALILAHVKELLEQAAGKLQVTAPDLPFGIYSAGLGRRDAEYAVTIAGIQSVYKKACDLGRYDLILIDEAHLIPSEGEGMYRQFLADARVVNPQVRVVGLTATPYRMKSGTICAPGNVLNAICYEVGVRELIVNGYLCPVTTRAGSARANYDSLHLRGGEYMANEVESLMDTDVLVESACAEIAQLTSERHSVLLFASGIEHALHIRRVLQDRHGSECGFVCGDTLPLERNRVLERFKEGDLKYLVNVNVLTTGFDAPNIDCVALLRPTMSPGLYYQMVGRGFRLHDSKTDCLVLDYGGNVLRHGPVDLLKAAPDKTRKNANGERGEAPDKECPQCHALIAAGYAVCPQCGYVFPEPERNTHDPTASQEGILSGEIIDEEFDVLDVSYEVYYKRNAKEGDPPTMRVEYQLSLTYFVSEWVCLEHSGFARQKARTWWSQRSHDPVPDTVEYAVYLAEEGSLATPEKITVRTVTGEHWPRIIKCELGEKPPAVGQRHMSGEEEDADAESVPSYIAAGFEEDDIPF